MSKTDGDLQGCNHRGLPVSHAVSHGFAPRPGHTKDHHNKIAKWHCGRQTQINNKSAKWHCGRHTLICKKILI